jgi:hypothetical protein
MSTPSGSTTNYSIFYILSIIAFMITCWIITGSIIWTLSGVVLGVLFAAFFVNVLVRDRE